MRSSPDLHGSAPDDAAVALLIVDMINTFDFDGGRALLAQVRRVAPRIRDLAARARRAGIPVVYLNDNFGRWRSDFRTVVAQCLRPSSRGRSMVRLVAPHREDYFVLKPKHSGFYATPLAVLLEHLSAKTVIVTGVAGNLCVLFTAQDAYLRGFRVIVPPDCIASESPHDTRIALEQMRRSLDAVTTSSRRLDLAALAASTSTDRP